jgi:hypothetical protein
MLELQTALALIIATIVMVVGSIVEHKRRDAIMRAEIEAVRGDIHAVRALAGAPIEAERKAELWRWNHPE